MTVDRLSFVDFDDIETDTSLGDSTYQLDDNWGRWDTDAKSANPQDPGDFRGTGGSCMGTAGDPPEMGTYVLGAIDGVCQWISTTDCS